MSHIALIAGTYQPERCGVAHYTAHLREAIAQQGVQSVVLTTHAAAAADADPSVMGAVHGWQLADLPSLVRAVHSTGADLLHIQHAAGTYGFDRAIFLLPLLLKLTGWRAPIVTTVHEYGWWEWHPAAVPPQFLEWLKTWGQRQGWWDREDGFLLTQSDALITTNRDAMQVIHTRLPHRAQRVHQIPIGANVEVTPIDRMEARHHVRHDCGWTGEVAIAAFFGFLHPVKGLETLLSAFKQVLAVYPRARLLLIGGVESLALPDIQAMDYWHQLEAAIATLNLTDYVHMTGYQDAITVSRYLAGVDVGVLPFNHGVTLKSGSLLALMAHALPTIATCATPPDPTLAAQTLLYPIAPRDIDGLATALIDLLQNPTRRHHLGNAGQQFSRQFTWSAIAAAHLTVYHSILS